MFLYTFIIRCILIKEDDYTGLSVYQTPHIGLSFLIVGVIAEPCLVHIHVRSVLKGNFLEGRYQLVQLHGTFVGPVQKVLDRSVPVHIRQTVLCLPVCWC